METAIDALVFSRARFSGRSALFEKNNRVCNRGVVKMQSLGCLCLQPYAFRMNAEKFCDTSPNCRRMRADFRGGQNETGIDIAHPIAGFVYTFQCFTQKNNRICTLPSRIGGRKQGSDIWCGDGTQQSIGDGVQQDVAIGMAAEALVMIDRNPADFQGNARTKFVGVKAVADSHRRSSVVSRWHQLRKEMA
jgi:hypothetical protein